MIIIVSLLFALMLVLLILGFLLGYRYRQMIPMNQDSRRTGTFDTREAAEAFSLGIENGSHNERMK